MFTLMQAYKIMFRVFNEYYNKAQDAETNDMIVSMLSFMSTDMCADGLPIDRAVWQDWKNVVEKISSDELLTEEQARQAAIDFLAFHYTEFGYPVKWIVDELNSKPLSDSIWSA